jgi:hypothetical protein
MIRPVLCPKKIVVIEQEWPCWLTAALALKLPLNEVYMSQEFRDLFDIAGDTRLQTLDEMEYVPSDWDNCTILVSGSHEYLSYILSKLRKHQGPFIYSTNLVVKGRRRRDVEWLYRTWSSLRDELGLRSRVVAHAEFGGVTSAFHLVSYWNVPDAVFDAPPALPRVLSHIINPASPDAAREIAAPPPPSATISRSVIVMEGLLRQEGLYDIF